MNLVDEQDVAFSKIRQQRCKVAGFFDNRSGSGLNVTAHLVGDDVSQGGLAESGRTVEQHVIESLPAFARGLDKDRQVLFGLVLTDVLAKQFRSETQLKLFLVVAISACGNDSVFHHSTKTPARASGFSDRAVYHKLWRR